MEQQRVDVLSKVKCDRKVGHCLNERVAGVKCAPFLVRHVIDVCVGDNAGAGKHWLGRRAQRHRGSPSVLSRLRSNSASRSTPRNEQIR